MDIEILKGVMMDKNTSLYGQYVIRLLRALIFRLHDDLNVFTNKEIVVVNSIINSARKLVNLEPLDIINREI